MKISRLGEVSREFAWGTILFVVILFVADAAFADPGLVPGWDGETSYVDSSDLVGGSSIRQRLDARQTECRSDGARCMRRVCTASASVPHKETVP
jgi:hypothetical protein